jgi:Ca-activated chloride channel family protein
MKKKWLVSILLVGFMLGVVVTPAFADGIIIPDDCGGVQCTEILPLEQLGIKYHHVTVTIDNQVAVTHVDQAFYNPNDWTIEGTYIFPLPIDAAVSNFVLWIDGQPVQGQVLEANQARQTYEQIVAQMRDPAILEYVGRGAIQARVFPIAPGEERRIELEYTQVLTAQAGLVQYTYPLNTEKFSVNPLDSVSVTVSINSDESIRAIYSPSHEIAISQQGTHGAVASYEASNVTPDTDFMLFYSIGESEAFHLFTYKDPTDAMDPNGFFLLLLAPRPEIGDAIVAKDVLLVLDRSGSMDGEKFRQAQQAAIYILQNLNEGDRFNVISFNTAVDSFAAELQSTDAVSDAVDWVGQWGAAGSTDINRALLEAAGMAGAERLTYIIFLTDGLPTEGVIDTTSILQNFDRTASGNIRLFVFGVGYDVDTFLLDSLAQEHHGLSKYVTEGMELDEVLSDFYNGISSPVMTDLQLDFGGLQVYDLYPQPLPDLFVNGQIIIVGRYEGGGKYGITLSGEVNGVRQVFHFNDQKFTRNSSLEENSMNQIPRLWATRKIGYLLNEIRLQGASQELIDQVVNISVHYGIVTPYTSYLVTEPAILSSTDREQIAQDTYNQVMSTPSAPTSGMGAVGKAAGEGALSQAEVAPTMAQEAASVVKVIGSKTFVSQNGIWTDTTYDLNTMHTQKIVFLSEEYFNLAAEHTDLASAFALGQKVIVVFEGQAYEIITGDPATSTLPIADARTSDELNVVLQQQCLGWLVPFFFQPIGIH